MSVTLTGAGSLFVRLGHIFGGIEDILALEGAAATARVLSGASWQTRGTTLETDYAAGTQLQSVLDGMWRDLAAWQGTQQGFISQLASLAERTIVEMVHADRPLASKTLQNALAELITQMRASGDDVNASTLSVGSQTAVGSPSGNPIIVVKTTDGDGRLMEYVAGEKLTFTVASDSQTGGATEGQEQFSVTGEAIITPTAAYNWPGGSGASTSINVADGEGNNSGNNLLYNSSFETFTTANYPDNWTTLVGVAGTTIFDGTSSNAYDGGAGSLRLLGDAGGTLSAVTQLFGGTPSTSAGLGGTPATLLPLTCYALNCWIKVSATPSAGVLEFSLIDGSGTTIADAQSVNNLTTQSLTGISTSWVNFNTVFRTPALLPSTIKLKIRLSTAIDNGKSVYIDRVALNRMTSLYTGGPWCSIFSGSDKVVTGDTWTIVIGNTYGTFQKHFQRLFDMRTLGLKLPSDTGGAETVADSLVA